jgi:hypothetical protein
MHLHDTGLHQVQAREEPADLRALLAATGTLPASSARAWASTIGSLSSAATRSAA